MPTRRLFAFLLPHAAGLQDVDFQHGRHEILMKSSSIKIRSLPYPCPQTPVTMAMTMTRHNTPVPLLTALREMNSLKGTQIARHYNGLPRSSKVLKYLRFKQITFHRSVKDACISFNITTIKFLY